MSDMSEHASAVARSALIGAAVALLASGPGTASAIPAPGADLDDPHKKDIAMQLVSSAENSTLDWRAQFGFLKEDGQGYTGGIIGFTSGTGDMLTLVELYTEHRPGNPLAPYLPALRRARGSGSHAGLGRPFEAAWRQAARDQAFRDAQESVRDTDYFNPAVRLAKADGLHALGQFAYYDAIVQHGPGVGPYSFRWIRGTVLSHVPPPARGGDEKTYLGAYLDARTKVLRRKVAHADTSRVETEQRVFLNAGNLELRPPLKWRVYGDPYEINW